MECPQCGVANPPGTSVCATCSTPLPFDERTLGVTATGAAAAAPAPDFDKTLTSGIGTSKTFRSPVPAMSEAAFAAALEPGSVLGNRYEIVQILGQGGMGAVYKARDQELERLVALKVIRPELAQYPEVLQRFKQELILAREVTHRNVIRIFDLGEANGIKFITMEYIEGRDLKSLIRERGKIEPKQAADIIAQVCRALEAAHSEGVIHRDLKPQNIMVDEQGKVSVMDFGIARSMEEVGGGMTQTGALVGTIEYMSPEQAKGEKLDQRTDLFSLGIIFYETLTGDSPYKADTAMASLYKRLKEIPRPPMEVNPEVPAVLNNIVLKCLAIEKEQRYSSATDILQDLEIWQGTRGGTVVAPARPRPPIQELLTKWNWVALGLAIVIAAGVGFFFLRGKSGTSTPSQTAAVAPQTSLAILPFRNTSGDPSLDWLGPSLADMLSTDVGQSKYMRTISPDRLHQVLSDLRVAANAAFDPTMISRIADFSSADTVVWGEFAKFGDQIRIDATLQDLKHGRTMPLKVQAASEKDIPGSVDQLAELIRKNLAVSSDVLKELKSSSFQPTSTSLDALRDYNQGLQLLRDGKNQDAVKSFQSATKEDPQFALAYSRLADADSALGYENDADQASSKAVDLSQALNVAEKYLIEASHYRIVKDDKKAIDAYENLAKSSDNSEIEYALGSLYLDTGDYNKAQAEFKKILQADPKNIKTLWQSGVVQIQMGNPQAALEPLNQGLSLAIQVDNQEQKALITLAMGICYRLMNKPDEAMASYQQSMDITKRLGLKRILANSLTEMALVQNSLGKSDAALASYGQALQLLNDIGMKKEYGNTLINRGILYESRGDYDKALQDYKDSLEIQRDANDENSEAICLNNIGGVYLSKGDTDNALTYLQQSLQLRQKTNNMQPGYVADTLNSLGEVYEATGGYDDALSSFMNALDVSRKANDAGNAAVESYEIGNVFRYQGRLGAAVSALRDAVAGYRAVNDRGVDMAQALADLADTLALAGQGSESAKLLDEARGLARDLKNDSLQSDLFNADGDVALYRGDTNAAKAAYTQALAAATRGKAPDKMTISKLNMAHATLAEGNSQAAITSLRAVIQQADNLHLKYYSLDASVYLA